MSFSKVGFDKAVMILCQLLFLLAVKKKTIDLNLLFIQIKPDIWGLDCG